MTQKLVSYIIIFFIFKYEITIFYGLKKEYIILMTFKTKNSSETNKTSGLWNLHIIKDIIIIKKIESLQKTCTLLYKIDII